MKAPIRTVLFLSSLALSACDRARTPELDEIGVAELAAAPHVDDAERHLVLTLSFVEGKATLEGLRLGVGPARVYPERALPLRLQLLDAAGRPFSSLWVEDPLRVRAYTDDHSAQVADPVVVRADASAFFVLPLDARLSSVRLLGDGYDATPIALADPLARLSATPDPRGAVP